jgi:GntR family transcriptional repressor for pyruvate dehydrogenase complex
MDELQYHILDLLAAVNTPNGSGFLLSGIDRRGVDVSQATLGRALRVLDERSLTVKVSNKGRVITPEGRRWLGEARRREGASRWTEQTLLAVGRSTLTELRQSMIARRAIEAEIARLVAENAAPAETAELRRIVENQGRDIRIGGVGANEALDFHLALARICGNRFLVAAANLVRTSSHSLETLMYHLGAEIGSSYDDHMEVAEAIAARDPKAAEEAMVRHLNELIKDIDVLLGRLSERVSLPVEHRSDGDRRGKSREARDEGRAGRPAGLGLE